MPSPLVSIIIPVGPRHTEHCLVAAASTRAQSIGRERVETILIADADAELGQVTDCITLPSTGAQIGPAKTRNRGIAIARGSFIVCLDADDYLLPRGLEHLLRAYGSGRHGYVYGNAYTSEPWHLRDQLRGQTGVTLDEQRQAIYALRSAPDYSQEEMRRRNQHVVTALVPTHHIRAVGGFDERVDAWEDWTLWLRLSVAGVCGHHIQDPIFVYRVYEGDRMTRFYRDLSTMEAIWALYRNEQGDIPMAGCCGGDNNLAQVAQSAAGSAQAPNPTQIAGGLIRVRYMGDEKGGIPFDFGGGRLIVLGASPSHLYQDVTPEEARWLAERIPIAIVAPPDPPLPPPPPLTSTPDAPVQAVRPPRKVVETVAK